MTQMLPIDLPEPRRAQGRPMIIDSFAGGGGASTGIEMALGRSPDVAINHNPRALAMHEANHPETRHLINSIYAVDPDETCRGRKVGLAWFSPDCFPAGTMVLSARGYVAIETLRVGDLVLTHNGRWRPVTQTMTTTRNLFEVKAAGNIPVRVSGEHPFYSRKSDHRWNNERRAYDRTLTDADWVKVTELCFDAAPMNKAGGNRSYWATPNRSDALPIPQIPTTRGRSHAISPNLMWLAGRYLGDGWTRLGDGRAELVISCGKHEAEALLETLSHGMPSSPKARSNELSWNCRELESSCQISTSCTSLVTWLRDEFGHGADQKRIPGWALGMERNLRTALLEGYMSAHDYDGEINGNEGREYSTVSKSLALGLRSLAETLGMAAKTYGPYANRNEIEGRKVNSKPVYTVRWRPSPIRATFVRDEGHTWRPFTSRCDLKTEALVYNISVEDDESYVADGMVVHNCTHHSKAKGGKPLDSGRRDLAWVVVHWAERVRPDVIMLENVEEFQDWCPLDENQRPDRTRIGETFRLWVARLRKLGYKVEWRELRACDYGAPTIRKRLFLVARCDGRPIVWPEPTHAAATDPRVIAGKLKPYLTSATDIIDWSLPVPSIFETSEEIKESLGLRVRRPLSDNTLARIARSIRKRVIDAPEPYIVSLPQGPAITGMVQTGYGERRGQAPRVLDPDAPIGTMVAGGAKHGIIAAFLAQHNGGPAMERHTGRDVTSPISTLTTSGSQQTLVSASLLSLHGNDRREASLEDPHPTICAGGTHSALVTTLLNAHGQGPVDDPVTIEVKGKRYAIADIGMRMLSTREMFRAQGFAETYEIDMGADGKPMTKTEQTNMCGNSVSPPVVRALVRANCMNLAVMQPELVA